MPQLSAFLITILICISGATLAGTKQLATFSAEQQLELEKLKNELSSKQQENSAKIDLLQQSITAKKEYDKDVLEGPRKSIDWWLTGLTLILAGAAFFVWRTKEKIESEWKEQKAEITSASNKAIAELDKARAGLERELRDSLKQSRSKIQELHQAVLYARQMSDRISDVHDEVKAMVVSSEASPDEKQQAQNFNEALGNTSPQAVLISHAMELERKAKWAEAAEIWRVLTKLNADNYQFWFNLGYSLNLSNAPLLSVLEAYDHSFKINPKEPMTLNNLANTLIQLAKESYNEEKWNYFYQAEEKFIKAIELEPQHHFFNENYGALLLEMAAAASGEDREKYLVQAEEKLSEPCNASENYKYNLACLRTMQGKINETKSLLEEALADGNLPSRETLASDATLTNIQELDWFKKILASLPNEIT